MVHKLGNTSNKRAGVQNGPSARKFAKISNEALRNSTEGMIRRRVLAQKTRLARSQQRLKAGDAEEAAKFHLDGCRSYEEAASGGDEVAAGLRLGHLKKLFALAKGAPAAGAVAAAALSTDTAAAAALEADLVMELLDGGDVPEAHRALDACAPRAGAPPGGRRATPLLFSRALADFVDWRGSDDEKKKEESDASAALRAKAEASLDRALAANPYVGVMLANLAIFVREIDPDVAAEAKHARALVPSEDGPAAAAAASPSSLSVASGPGKKCKAAVEPDDDEDDDKPHGRFEGSVEEALAYASGSGGCWMDFIGAGVEAWVAGRLELLGEGVEGGGEGGVRWPPRRCSREGQRFVDLFVAAAEVAEAEEDEEEDEEEDVEEEDDDEEK